MDAFGVCQTPGSEPNPIFWEGTYAVEEADVRQKRSLRPTRRRLLERELKFENGAAGRVVTCG